jgi:hypothetical protein
MARERPFRTTLRDKRKSRRLVHRVNRDTTHSTSLSPRPQLPTANEDRHERRSLMTDAYRAKRREDEVDEEEWEEEEDDEEEYEEEEDEEDDDEFEDEEEEDWDEDEDEDE